MRSAVLTLLVAAACGSSHPPASPEPTPHPSRSAFAHGAHGVRLHYLDFGGTGEPVVLLAGAGNSAWIYADLGAVLAREHRVIAITRRGHGESEQPTAGYDLPTLDADLALVLDELKLPRAILVGHSLAGAELTYFAGHHPERVIGLVYLDAAYDRSIQGPVMEAAPYEGPDATEDDRASVETWIAYVRRTRPDLARYWDGPVVRDLQVSIEMGADHRAGWRTRTIFGEYWTGTAAAPPDYTKVTAPVLAIYSVEDEAYTLPAGAAPELIAAQRAYESGPLKSWRDTSIAQLRAAIPAAEVVTMDAGHHMFLHHPRETVEHLQRFFARLR